MWNLLGATDTVFHVSLLVQHSGERTKLERRSSAQRQCRWRRRATQCRSSGLDAGGWGMRGDENTEWFGNRRGRFGRSSCGHSLGTIILVQACGSTIAKELQQNKFAQRLNPYPKDDCLVYSKEPNSTGFYSALDISFLSLSFSIAFVTGHCFIGIVCV